VTDPIATDPVLGLLTPLVLPPDVRPAVPAAAAPPAGATLGQHYVRCYGCGDAQPAGLKMRFVVGEGVRVVARFVVTEDHEGAPGLAHGGLLTAALDETQATLLWLLQTPAVTARLETDFLAPVPVGAVVRIEAACLGVADRKIYTAAEGRLEGAAAEGRLKGAAAEGRLEGAAAEGRLEGAAAEGRLEGAAAEGVLALRSAALFVAVPVEHFTAFGRRDLVEASMHRQAAADEHRFEVNP
jgi:acyl-coenzyme A thioesterase PaaI-like protein